MRDNLSGDNDWAQIILDVMAVIAGLIGVFAIVVQCAVEGYHWLLNGFLANYNLLHFMTEDQIYLVLDTEFMGLKKIIIWALSLWVSLLFLTMGLLLAWFLSMISRVKV